MAAHKLATGLSADKNALLCSVTMGKDYNWELYIGKEECPGVSATMKDQDNLLLAPARNNLTIWTSELLPCRRSRGLVRKY
jgi:hypothetical protein